MKKDKWTKIKEYIESKKDHPLISDNNDMIYLEILEKMDELEKEEPINQYIDVKTLNEISIEYGIPIKTLYYRLKYLKENIEYKKLGKKLPTLLTPEGVNKIIENVYKTTKNK